MTTENKSCLYCGAELTRKTLKDGKLEANFAHRRRDHCDRTCADRAKHGPRGKPTKVEIGDEVPFPHMARSLWR